MIWIVLARKPFWNVDAIINRQMHKSTTWNLNEFVVAFLHWVKVKSGLVIQQSHYSMLKRCFSQKYANHILNVQSATSLMTFCHQKAALSHVFQVSVCSKGDQTLFVRYWYCLRFGPWAVFAHWSVGCFLPADIVFLNWVWYIKQRGHAVQSYKPWLPLALCKFMSVLQLRNILTVI